MSNRKLSESLGRESSLWKFDLHFRFHQLRVLPTVASASGVMVFISCDLSETQDDYQNCCPTSVDVGDAISTEATSPETAVLRLKPMLLPCRMLQLESLSSTLDGAELRGRPS